MKSKQPRAQQREKRVMTAAAEVVHRRGVGRTTLNAISSEADIPLGSLYYYFRSKDDIVHAIVGERLRSLRELLAEWEGLPSPLRRLEALLDQWLRDREVDARYGCPIGSLCYELAKERGAMSEKASQPLRLLLEWSEAQFAAMGHTRGSARDRALHLMSALQGVSLVSNAFADPEMITREMRYLRAWLRGL